MNISDKSLPFCYNEKENCCGCSACYAVCPTDAVYMAEKQDGFLYPEIDSDRCARFYQCTKVCVFK